MRIAIILAAVAIAAAGAAAAEIFAASDVYSFAPDGQCLELTGGGIDSIQRGNVHWNAARKTIRLYGAQNEEVACQIVIAGKGDGYHAEADRIGAIPAERVRFSAIGYVRKKGELIPDLVLPLDGTVKGIRDFSVPLKVRGLPEPNNKLGVMLMEVWIPKTARPGMHQGRVRIKRGDEVIETLRVEVTVFPFAIPDRPTFRLDYLVYASPLKRMGLDVTMPDGGSKDWTTPDEAIRVEHAIYKQTLDNRGFMNILPYHSQRGRPYYAYPVQGTGKSAKIAGFDGFDKRFGPVLDGKTNKYGEPPALFTTAFNINYPHGRWSDTKRHFDFKRFKKSIPDGPGKEPRLKEYEDTYRAVAQQFIDHVAEKGWTKTGFEIYFNQKPQKNNRTPWKLDEPTYAADYKGLHYLYSVAKWAFQGAAKKGVKIVIRIDIGHWECDSMKSPTGGRAICYKRKQFNTGGARRLLQPLVDRWVAGVTHTEGAQHLIAEYNTDEVLFDQYGSVGMASRVHYGEYAGLCWKLAVMGIEGRAFYKMGADDPNKLSTTAFLYRGTSMGHKGVLLSRRMKLWRDSVNDFELIRMAREKDPSAAKEVLEKMVRMGLSANLKYRERSKSKGFWFTNNVEDIQRARAALAKIISGRDYRLGEIEGFSKKFTPCGSPDQIVGYD